MTRTGLRVQSLAAAAGAAAIVIASTARELTLPLNGDAQWLLTMAGDVLDGQRLYRDIFEINPPLIVWLQLPLVSLARATGATPATVLRLAVVLLAVVSAILTCRLLARVGLPGSATGRRWLPALLLFVLLWVPGGTFGQREQILTILLCPFLAIQVIRLEGEPVGRAAGLGAGIGAGIAIAIKPQFIGVWAFAAAYRAWATRRLWPESEDLAIVGVGFVYLAAVLTITPEFIGQTRAFAPTYMGFAAASPLEILASPAVIWFGAAALAWAVSRTNVNSRDSIGAVLLLAGLAATVAVLLQRKGWTYHFLPVVCFAVLLGAAAIARLRDATGARRVSGLIAATILLASWAPLGRQIFEYYRGNRPGGQSVLDREVSALSQAVAAQRGARSILVLSADMTSSLPWIEGLGLSSNNSISYLWIPTAVYRSHSNPRASAALRRLSDMPPVERVSYEAIVKDLVAGRPDLLAVETRARNARLTGYPGGFDHLRYYGADPRFAAELAHYQVVATVAGFQVFRRVTARGMKAGVVGPSQVSEEPNGR